VVFWRVAIEQISLGFTAVFWIWNRWRNRNGRCDVRSSGGVQTMK